MNRTLFLNTRLALLGLSIAFQGQAVAEDRHSEPTKGAPLASSRPSGEETGTAAYQDAMKRIKRMVEIVDGRVAPVAAKPGNTEMPFLTPRETLSADLVKKLMKSLDDGTIGSALVAMLQQNESYTGIESEEVFEYDGTKPFDALTKEEKVKIAAEYTKARKELRAKLWDEVTKMLRKEADPRAKLIARAVEITLPDSQRAYDVAIEKIESENLEHPLCLTCGEAIAPENAKNPEDKDYDFYEQMGNSAQKAVASVAGLAPAKAREATAPVRFSPNGKLYTGNGSTIHDLTSGNTHNVKTDKSGTWLYDGKNLNSSAAEHKEALALALDVTNRPFAKPGSTPASSAGGAGLGAVGNAKSAVPMASPAVAPATSGAGYVFSGSSGYEQAYNLAVKNNKPLVVYIGAPWCSSCKLMKKDSLEPMKSENGGRLEDTYFVELDFDADKEKVEQMLSGTTIPQTIVYAKDTAGAFKRFSLTGMQSIPRVRELIGKARDTISGK